MRRILIINSDFSSAHKYENKNWTQLENKKAFGRCYTEFGHGHNYKIEVGFELAAETKNKDLKKINTLLQNKLKLLTQKLDHEHLNFVVPEFKTKVPTTENILLYFEKKLRALELQNSLAFIKLFEMDNLWSEKYYVTK